MPNGTYSISCGRDKYNINWQNCLPKGLKTSVWWLNDYLARATGVYSGLARLEGRSLVGSFGELQATWGAARPTIKVW